MRKTVTLDSKRRATFPKPFQPGDTFAIAEEGGVIRFQRLEKPEPKVVKAKRVKGGWVADLGLTREQIAQAIREDRDSR